MKPFGEALLGSGGPPETAAAVLVTGAAGFIGSHLCERLLADGHEVVGLDSFDDFYPPRTKEDNLRNALDHECFELVRGDIRDPAALRSLPDRIGSVVHLAARAAARASIAAPALYSDINVTGTAHLLQWSRRRALRSFVFASSSSAYGDLRAIPFAEEEPPGLPLSPYGATKRAGELMCAAVAENGGPSVACLRYFTVYGPRQRPDLAIHDFARRLRDGEPIPLFGDGGSSRDYTYVGDIVDGTVRALGWVLRDPVPERFRVFNLGQGRAISLAEMVRALADVSGRPPLIEHHPEHAADLPHTVADITRARAELGYDPATMFRDGIAAFTSWFADGNP